MAQQELVRIWPEAAQALGIGRTTAYNLVWNGQIDSVYIGSRRLIPRRAIDEYVRRLPRTRAGSGEELSA